MYRRIDNMIRPLKWISKLLGLPETNIVKCYVLQPGYKMEEPKLVEASTFLFLRFASFQWNLHHGSKLHVKLLQNRWFFKKANWQVKAMYLMYLWFRKTRISIRGQTIPRIQIAIWILHDFFSFY